MSKTNKDKNISDVQKEGYFKKSYRKKLEIEKQERMKGPAGHKILPKPDDLIHLHDYGYSTKESNKKRQQAIRKAMKDNPPLKVLQRLNLLRNYQSIPSVKQTFNKDVEYAKDLYKKIKQKGGDDDSFGTNIIGDSIEDSLIMGGVKKCPKGKILRKGYYRKGYTRKSYDKGNGTHVSESDVEATYVPPTCIPDRGGPGKGPYTLPPIKEEEVKLRKYGYSVHKSTDKRHKALDEASDETDTLLVLRHLNLIRNYQADPYAKEIMNQDMEYMKKKYSKIREKKGPAHGTYVQRSRRRKQKGGVDNLNEDLDDSDVVVDNVNLPEQTMVAVKTQYDTKEVCDSKGKCNDITVVHESHNINGTKIMFYTLDTQDADSVLELDLNYFDSDETKEEAIEKLESNYGYLIGMKTDEKLQGYCQYKPIDNETVKIVWFCANKGYGTPLYSFMEKFFIRKKFSTIIIIVSLEGSYAVRRLNFWYDKGFSTYESKADDKKVLMEKKI